MADSPPQPPVLDYLRPTTADGDRVYPRRQIVLAWLVPLAINLALWVFLFRPGTQLRWSTWDPID